VRLKQVCNHPALLKGGSPKGELGDTALQVHSGKLQRLEEMLEEVLAEGDRCLIFTQFAEWGKLLQVHLHQRFNREVLYLYGSTSKKQREEMVDRFQNDPQAPRILFFPLSGWCRLKLNPRQPRLSLRSLVEPGSRKSSNRSRLPNWANPQCASA